MFCEEIRNTFETIPIYYLSKYYLEKYLPINLNKYMNSNDKRARLAKTKVEPKFLIRLFDENPF